MMHFKEFKKHFWNTSFETLVSLTCLNQSNTFSSEESLFALFLWLISHKLYLYSHILKGFYFFFCCFFSLLFTYFLLSYNSNVSQLRMQLQSWGGTVLVWKSWLEYPAVMPPYSDYISCLWNKYFFMLAGKYLISRVPLSLLNRV